MIFHVYILESESSGAWYYGFTEDIDQRLRDHQSNRSKYTRFKGPWKLIFKRAFLDKTEALRFEKYLKTTRNKDYIMEKFKDHFILH
ncbi:MAG: GIY-YIG nuclease family protein [Cytophagia bacterium]|nr:GIY-YIG nuclease family protein [Cytophagia bacterium]